MIRHQSGISRLALLAVIIFHFTSLQFAHADAEKFTALLKENGEQLFTIYLPQQWTMNPSENDTDLYSRFVFGSPGGNLPYLFVDVRPSDSQTRARQLAEADQSPHKDFLSRGEAGHTYFDAERFLLWKTSAPQSGTIVISATYIDDSIHKFKFFVEPAEFDSFRRTLVQIVENIEFHGNPPSIEGRTPLAKQPLSEGEAAVLFEFKTVSSVQKLALFVVVMLSITLLYAINWTIQWSRHQTLVAELEQKKKERIAAQYQIPPNTTPQAESYLREISTSPRRAN